MLIGSFAFANTSFDNFETKTKENSFELSKENSSTTFNDNENGCWVYVRYVDSRGNVVGRGRYWDANCTVVGGRGVTVVISSLAP